MVVVAVPGAWFGRTKDVLEVGVRHLVGAGVLATTADAATTWLAMEVAAANASVRFVELNPAVAALITAHGAVVALSIKGLLGLGMFAFLGWAAGRSRWGVRPLMVATTLTCVTVAWNVRMLAVTLA